MLIHLCYIVSIHRRSSMEAQELSMSHQYENGFATVYNSFSPRGKQPNAAASPTQNLSLSRDIDSPRGSSISSRSPSSSPSQASSLRSESIHSQQQHIHRNSSAHSTPEHQRYSSQGKL